MKNSVGLNLPEYAFNKDQTVLIIGAGLAGCAIARALAKRGYQCKVFDQHATVSAATSSLPVAVVRPAVKGDQFFTSYFDYAFDLCCNSIDEQLFTQCGALELTGNSNNSRCIKDKPGYEFVTAGEASTLAGSTITSNALYVAHAGFVKPQALGYHWLQHHKISFQASTKVTALHKTQYGWQLLSESGSVIDESRVVILATAQQTTAFDVAAGLPLQSAAGQIDLFEYTSSPLKCIVNGNGNNKGYLLPDSNGVWCGATHHPLQQTYPHTDDCLSSHQKADSQLNIATAASIAPALSISATPAASFAAVRTFTPDRLPVVGALHDTLAYRKNYTELRHGKPDNSYPPACFHEGLYLATGLGSRGATQALVIGELICHLVSGDHLQDCGQHTTRTLLRQQFLHGLHPARFLIRALRRGL